MRILHLDIETAPNTVHVWGLWNQNVSIKQVQDSSYTMCWAAMWYTGKTVYFDSVFESTHRKMVKGIHSMIDEADVVVHYNGNNIIQVTMTTDATQAVDVSEDVLPDNTNGLPVEFTYSVQWHETPVVFSKRLDHFDALSRNPIHLEVRLFR